MMNVGMVKGHLASGRLAVVLEWLCGGLLTGHMACILITLRSVLVRIGLIYT